MPDNEATSYFWSRIRPHMPPWLHLDSQSPLLCHEFKVGFQLLSGRGNEDNPEYATSNLNYCALFQNMIIFYQGSFGIPDETDPFTVSKIACLGFVFLQNLDIKVLVKESATLQNSFKLDLIQGDSIHFSHTLDSVGETWYNTLERFLREKPVPPREDYETFIRVYCLANLSLTFSHPSIYIKLLGVWMFYA